MPKYRIYVSRLVQQTASFDQECASEEEALNTEWITEGLDWDEEASEPVSGVSIDEAEELE